MLIAIDNGHGIDTPGKRTPVFPEGGQTREWQFNYPTAQKLGTLLRNNGFDILFVSDTEADTPLITRVSRANQAKADLFVSIHYNAFQGVWGPHGGIETYHYATSVKGKKLAQEVQQELIKETGLRDRGVKTAAFYVIKETNMPAILAECGFMDNLEEARFMLNEAYQLSCAQGIAKGICSYFKMAYVEEEVHWAEPYYKRLNEAGVEVLERRFNDPITRGETMVLMDRLIHWIKGER